VADLYPPIKQRAALKKFAAAIDSSPTALRIDECGDPRIEGSSGHVYATPDGFQLFVSTPSARAWTAAKKALEFARVCNDGDEEGAFILDRLPTFVVASVIRRCVGIRKRRHMTEDARLAAIARLKSPVKGVAKAEKVAMDGAEART
jgi:hypothetical protein